MSQTNVSIESIEEVSEEDIEGNIKRKKNWLQRYKSVESSSSLSYIKLLCCCFRREDPEEDTNLTHVKSAIIIDFNQETFVTLKSFEKEGKHFIYMSASKVNKTASRTGLRDYDEILQVNNDRVDTKTSTEVKDLIMDSINYSSRITVLRIAREEDKDQVKYFDISLKIIRRIRNGHGINKVVAMEVASVNITVEREGSVRDVDFLSFRQYFVKNVLSKDFLTIRKSKIMPRRWILSSSARSTIDTYFQFNVRTYSGYDYLEGQKGQQEIDLCTIMTSSTYHVISFGNSANPELLVKKTVSLPKDGETDSKPWHFIMHRVGVNRFCLESLNNNNYFLAASTGTSQLRFIWKNDRDQSSLESDDRIQFDFLTKQELEQQTQISEVDEPIGENESGSDSGSYFCCI